MSDFDQYRRALSRPDWHSSPAGLPPAVAQWLLHSGSLTTKMQQNWRAFRVTILRQGWQAVGSDTLFTKKPPVHTACEWLREVVIESDEQPRIFAQTRLPLTTVEKVAGAVLTLGEQPIGAWLFPQQPQRLSLAWRYDPHSDCYARCSTLSLKGYPLDIRELFLPAFPFEAVPRKA